MDPGLRSLPGIPRVIPHDFDDLIAGLREVNPNLAERAEARLLAKYQSSFERPVYVFVNNDPPNHYDLFGLWDPYGSYCGPGWCGGKAQSEKDCACDKKSLPPPRDSMDQCCKNHDMCLGSGLIGSKCDDAMCKCLSGVDWTSLTPPPGKDMGWVYREWRDMLGLFCGTSPHP